MMIVQLQLLTLWVAVVAQEPSAPQAVQSCKGCAQALLIVAHPDDETLFAGELLLGRVAMLPGGCRRACWHVVCVTLGKHKESRDMFQRAVLVARSHGMAADISMEIWDYDSCDFPGCESFHGDAESLPTPKRAPRASYRLSLKMWVGGISRSGALFLKTY